MESLEKIIEKGEEEGGNIEFKSSLNKSEHLVSKRKDSLVGQMRHRILSGSGEAKYVVGVMDDGTIEGLNSDNFDETVSVLSVLSDEAGGEIDKVETWSVEGSDKKVGIVNIVESSDNEYDSDHILVGTAGHVDHGKSTLVGSIVSGNPDDGKGSMRKNLDELPHEVERGLSADLSHSVYGFSGGDVVHLEHVSDKHKSELVEKSDRVVSFVDTVGHRPWLRTTIRGIVGQRLDYGLLAVAANEGVTKTTKEHLGVLLAMDLPVIVAITKSDLVDQERMEDSMSEIKKMLRDVGHPSLVCTDQDADQIVEEIGNGVIPIIETSAVEMEGLDKLNKIFSKVPKNQDIEDGEFEMYIDKVYNVEGVGTVVSGTVKSGSISKGDEVLLGPTPNGNMLSTEVQSIEVHYHEVDTVESGQIAGISIRGVDANQINRGMILTSREDLEPTKSFEAEIMVLNHPTSVTNNYEPVVHLETISETAYIKTDEKLIPGEKGVVEFQFKFNPYIIQEGQKFIFREGKAKGIGTVREIK